MSAPNPHTGSFLNSLGQAVTANPWVVVVIWVVAMVLAYLTPFIYGPVTDADTQSALGPDQPYSQAQSFARTAFPNLYASADAVLVYARERGLTQDDLSFIQQVVNRLQNPPQDFSPFLPPTEEKRNKILRSPAIPWKVRSHFLTPYLTPRFLSTDAKTGRPTACLVPVSYDLPYNTEASFTQVKKIDALARYGLEQHPGLQLELTGTAGLGRDRQTARIEDHDRIRYVTVLAVLVVLLVVYRAPLAACIPLLTIAASAIVATKILRVFMSYGAPISGTELTYLVVIVFGSGTDYALFWMSRYREELQKVVGGRLSTISQEKKPNEAQASLSDPSSISHHPSQSAAHEAYVTTAQGILSSAGTTILGLAALVVSLFQPMRVTGLILAFALLISLVASLTLMPALGVLLGKWLFWPRKYGTLRQEYSPFWRRSALWVTRHPWQVILCIAVLMAGPIYVSSRVHYRFDITGETHGDSSFERGRKLAEKHFGAAVLFPWTLLVQFSPEKAPPTGFQLDKKPLISPQLANNLQQLSRHIVEALQTGGTKNIWSYVTPLGQTGLLSMAGQWAGEQAQSFYYSPQERALRFEVMGSEYPFSDSAIAQFKESLHRVESLLTKETVNAQAYAVGPTAYMANIKEVSDVDEPRVQLAVILAVGVVVFLLVRNLPLTLALLLITLLAYYATLGLVSLVFVNLLGRSGVDWEIKIFSFVILMAIGQDYNLFLVSRLVEERRRRALRPAVRRALIRTAGIISNCGLITAVSLGSLSTSGLQYLQQMGFALACGALLDTFVIRPFLLPSLLVLWHRPTPTRATLTTSPATRA